MIDLRNLKRGDKIRRIHPGGSAYDFIVGKEYEVYVTAGYPYVREENGTKYDSDSLEANAAYWEHVEPEEEQVGFVYVDGVTAQYGEYGSAARYFVNVETDRQGLDSLRKLQQKSEAQEELRNKDIEIAALEERLERLKEERKTLI